MSVDLLPDCRARDGKAKLARFNRGGLWCVPVFCGNCFKPEGSVPEDTEFAFILCDACGEKFGEVAGLYKMPMEVFWAKVMEAQMEKHGRLLTNEELAKALDDPSHPVSLLAKERPH